MPLDGTNFETARPKSYGRRVLESSAESGFTGAIAGGIAFAVAALPFALGIGAVLGLVGGAVGIVASTSFFTTLATTVGIISGGAGLVGAVAGTPVGGATGAVASTVTGLLGGKKNEVIRGQARGLQAEQETTRQLMNVRAQQEQAAGMLQQAVMERAQPRQAMHPAFAGGVPGSAAVDMNEAAYQGQVRDAALLQEATR